MLSCLSCLSGTDMLQPRNSPLALVDLTLDENIRSSVYEPDLLRLASAADPTYIYIYIISSQFALLGDAVYGLRGRKTRFILDGIECYISLQTIIASVRTFRPPTEPAQRGSSRRAVIPLGLVGELITSHPWHLARGLIRWRTGFYRYVWYALRLLAAWCYKPIPIPVDPTYIASEDVTVSCHHSPSKRRAAELMTP
jgi:hypothetical protein